MASRGYRNRAGTGSTLPDAVPLELPHLTRLSWELGSRVVEDDAASLHSRWEHTGASWSLSVIEVTSTTALLCVRTPTGRERFYGVARMDLNEVLPNLETAPRWRRAG
jgi:hypothetical protein